MEYLISIASTPPLKVYHLQEVKPQIEGVYGWYHPQWIAMALKKSQLYSSLWSSCDVLGDSTHSFLGYCGTDSS